jgi:hypothetical protein
LNGCTKISKEHVEQRYPKVEPCGILNTGKEEEKFLKMGTKEDLVDK